MNKVFVRITPSEAEKPLRRVNNVLLVILVVVNLYVISVPFMPQALFLIEETQGKRQALEDSLKRPPEPPATTGSPQAQPAGQSNRVVIPAMLLDKPVIEGRNMYRALDQGIWRWPDGSAPDKGGNTVLVGHRFTYTQPKGVFYFLDKLRPGDTVGIVWNNKTYVYRVFETQVVPPTQTSILDPTEEPILTMYTCTPLWLPKDRLVIKAYLESAQG